MEQITKFYQQYPVRKFQKGEIILVQGEVPTSAYFVKSGIVKSYNLTALGEEKPIGFEVTGDGFPVAWMFGKARYAQFYHEALSDCELYAVPSRDYVAFLRQHPDRLYVAFDNFVSKYIGHQMRINALEQSKAASKVVYTIHFLCVRFGRTIKEDVVRIALPLTQQDLANFMGLTRETTGIELKKLQRKGVLTYKNQNYVVRTDMLDELLDEDYDHGLST